MVTSDLRIFSGTSAMDMFPPVISFPQSSSIIDHFSFLFWPNCLQLLNRRQSCRLARALSCPPNNLGYLVLAVYQLGPTSLYWRWLGLFVADWQSKQTKRKRCMYIQNLRQIWIWFDFKSFLEISINFKENWRCTCMSNIQIIEKKLFQKVTKSFNPNSSFRIALNSIQY